MQFTLNPSGNLWPSCNTLDKVAEQDSAEMIKPRLSMKYFLLLLTAMQVAACNSSRSDAADPAAIEAAYQTGISLIEQKNFKAAKSHLMRAQPFVSNDPDLLMALAIAADLEGDFKISERAYGELLLRDTNKSTLYNNMGYSYMLRGDLEKAYAYLSEASRYQAENLTISNNLEMLRKVTPL